MKQLKQTTQQRPPLSFADAAYERVSREIPELQQQLKERLDWVAALKRFSGLSEAVHAVAARQAPKPVGRPRSAHTGGPRTVSGKAITPEVENVLRRVGHPLTRTQLVAELKREGIKVTGADKERNVAAVLWRDRARVMNLKGHGYWIASEPCEAVAYRPPLVLTAPKEEADAQYA